MTFIGDLTNLILLGQATNRIWKICKINRKIVCTVWKYIMTCRLLRGEQRADNLSRCCFHVSTYYRILTRKIRAHKNIRRVNQLPACKLTSGARDLYMKLVKWRQLIISSIILKVHYAGTRILTRNSKVNQDMYSQVLNKRVYSLNYSMFSS